MKTSTTLKLHQKPTINTKLQRALQLLQLPILELNQTISDVIEKNPLLEYEEPYHVNPEAQVTFYTPPPHNSDTEHDDDIHDLHHSIEDLHSHILSQIQLFKLTPKQLLIATMIIDYINDDGYVTLTLSELLKIIREIGKENCSLAEIKQVLIIIQTCEPIGIGAKDLKDCLLIQLNNMPKTPNVEQAIFIVKHHLHLVAEQNFKKLEKITKLTPSKLQKIIILIRSLNPKPGSKITNNKIDYLIPDIIAKKKQNHWIVILNNSILPDLKINYDYVNLIPEKNEEELKYVNQQLEEARWLINALRIRDQSLMKVAHYIVNYQQAFFECGELFMKPLTITKIAKDLNLSISTISRIINQKYIYTPKGTFKLRYFIANTAHDKITSTKTIQALIKNIISDKKYDGKLTDHKIAEILSKEGVLLSRRTVAKYRNILKIAPAHK